MRSSLKYCFNQYLLIAFCLFPFSVHATETLITQHSFIYEHADSKKSLSEIKIGEEVFIIQVHGEWARIAWKNIAGWIKTQNYQTKTDSLVITNPVASTRLYEGKCTFCSKKYPTRLQSHEPNFLGFTNDDNDVPYLDFKVSLKYPLFWDGSYSERNYRKWKLPFLYLAFTGRFGQYISTRDSSPVVGKRFNPELIGRYWLNDETKFVDISFGHESNGQSIDSEAEYLDARRDLTREGQDPEFARDFISRGWDYVGINWQHLSQKDNYAYGYGLKLQYFLNKGPFQGEAENSNTWENDGDNIFRRQYDGITVSTQFAILKPWLPSLGLSYTTGYDDIFQNSTFKIDSTVLLGSKGVPIVFWASRGFNSDFVDFYKRTTSFGIALKLKTYLGQGN